MQKFLESTLVSNYIKYLMMKTHLPKCSYISDGDIMIQDNYYLYRGNIYLCTNTGLFKGSSAQQYSYTYCSDAVVCGAHDSGSTIVASENETYLGQTKSAKYSFVTRYNEGEYIEGVTDTFLSNRHSYDADTHMRLGEYLRMLNSQYGLNLMPLYNCFSGKFVDNVSVASSNGNMHISDEHNNNQRVTLVPIKFNKKYSVSISSDFPIFMAPVLYDGKLIKDKDNKFFMPASDSVTKIGRCSNKNPIQFEVGNYDPVIGQYERFLYLMISMTKDVDAPVVVLEGDYTDTNNLSVTTFDRSAFRKSTENNLNRYMSGKYSLLQLEGMTLADTPAFSDKLIGYLLGHFIDQRDDIPENVDRVVKDIGYSTGKDKGWTNYLRSALFNSYMQGINKYPNRNYLDILGYVDSDIERAIRKGEIYVGK